MTSVFAYTDYRTYLAEWLAEKEKSHPSFSSAVFEQMAGISDGGILHDVLRGDRDLDRENVMKISRAVGHGKDEAEYFKALVFFNNASDLRSRNRYYEKLNSVKSRSREFLKARRSRKEQYEFYAQWHHCAVRALIDMYPFKDDYRWLARNVYPAITERQARRSVHLLETLGLIQKSKDGIYRLTDRSVTTSEAILSLAVHNFHRDAADLAKAALEKLPIDKRNIAGLTVGISEKTYFRICDEIQEFRHKIAQLARHDTGADRTYQLNFHLFPITVPGEKSGGKPKMP
jgi:uncharacterized protein (TIGR02147 family)